MQSAVYGTAFFNGTVQSMGSTIVALLVVALIDKNLALLIGIILVKDLDKCRRQACGN